MDPPAVYSRWWSLVEQCAAVSAKSGDVSWIVVPANTKLRAGLDEVDAYWDQSRKAIVVKQNALYAGELIRHEMLHAQLQHAGHPREQFLRRCGGGVNCVDRCLLDAGQPRTDPTAIDVPSDSLVVQATVEPAQPGISIDGGFFVFTVKTRNPYPYPVRVSLPQSGDAGPSVLFSYLVSSPALTLEYNDRVLDPEQTLFYPGETKQRVFDFVVRSLRDMSFALEPGTYVFRGLYGARVSQPDTVTATQ
jgi:hypothetical protein